MNSQQRLLARDVFVMGVSLVVIFVGEHRLGMDFFDGGGGWFIGASLILAVVAVAVGTYFRSIFLGRCVFFVSLTLAVVLVLGSHAFGRRGDFGIGALLVLLLVALPLAVYLGRPSTRRELPFVFDLRASNRAMARADFGQAEERAVKAVRRADAFPRNRDLSLGMALAQLGSIYRVLGRLEDSESALQQALGHWEATQPRYPGHRATTLLTLAATYISRGRFGDAWPLCREVLAFAEHRAPRAGALEATALLNIGQLLAGEGDHEEAERVTRRAAGLLSKQIERGQALGCIALGYLADLHRRQGRLSEAEPLARRALELSETHVSGPRDPTPARFLNVLAEIRRQQGDLDEAESLCQRSQNLIETAFGSQHIGLDGCLATLARIRIAQGRHAEAEQLFRRCLAILDAVVLPEHRERVERAEEHAALLRYLNGPR